jgi:two-component system, LytTR family, response regulator
MKLPMICNTVHVGGRISLPSSEILYIQADVNYSIIKMLDGSQFIVATTLKTLEDRLSETGFIRPNKSYLINQQYITNYKDGTLRLTNETTYMFSRRKRQKYDLLMNQN